MTLLLPRIDPQDIPEGACSAWTFTAREVVIGAHPYEIESEDFGLFVAPEIRRVASARPFAHGMVSAGPDYLGEQAIVIPVAIIAASEDEALALLTQLSADWVPADAPLDATVTTPLGAFLLTGKPDPLDVSGLGEIRQGIVHATARWWVTDPALRSTVTSEMTLSLGGVVMPEGHGYPTGFAHGFDPGSGAAYVGWAYNAGNFPASWTASISCPTPLVNPALELLGTGEILRCLTTVPVGTFLVIDQAAHAVWLSSDPHDLSGAADRSYTVAYPDAADWWALPAGSSQVRLSSSSGDGTAVIRWHSTYLL